VEIEFMGNIGIGWRIINISSNGRQQFPHPVILTPDDDHIGRNM
jgi:hypothetical protein